jgi:hypothetical protein
VQVLWEDDFTPCLDPAPACANGLNLSNWGFDYGDGSDWAGQGARARLTLRMPSTCNHAPSCFHHPRDAPLPSHADDAGQAGWGNNELQCYVDDDSVARVEAKRDMSGGGQLVLQANKAVGRQCFNPLVRAACHWWHWQHGASSTTRWPAPARSGSRRPDSQIQAASAPPCRPRRPSICAASAARHDPSSERCTLWQQWNCCQHWN